MSADETIERFVKDRNEALLSLDEFKIRAFMEKYGLPSFSENVFWAAVHKAITGAQDLPIEFRRKSKEWLTSRCMQSFDDGDL